MPYTAGATMVTDRSVTPSHSCFIYVDVIVVTCFAVGYRQHSKQDVPVCSGRLQQRHCGCGIERKHHVRDLVPRKRVLFRTKFLWTGALVAAVDLCCGCDIICRSATEPLTIPTPSSTVTSSDTNQPRLVQFGLIFQ